MASETVFGTSIAVVHGIIVAQVWESKSTTPPVGLNAEQAEVDALGPVPGLDAEKEEQGLMKTIPHSQPMPSCLKIVRRRRDVEGEEDCDDARHDGQKWNSLPCAWRPLAGAPRQEGSHGIREADKARA